MFCSCTVINLAACNPDSNIYCNYTEVQPDMTRISVYQSISDVQVRTHCGFMGAVHASSLSQKKTLRTPDVKTRGH